jgi:2'-hydroxyisoflavone reductase
MTFSSSSQRASGHDSQSDSSLPRRRFLTLATAVAAAGAAATAGSAFGRRSTGDDQPKAQGAGAGEGRAAKPLSILILGGTAFLGPETVEAARARGHTVTLFNRGKTRPELFPDVEKLRGDRDPNKGEGLKALEGRSWDIVLDNSGYFPRHVRASAELLAPKTKQYIFISSISAFKEGAPPNSDESFPVATLPDPNVETMGPGGQFYGGLKAACEAAAEAAMPGRTTNIRPGFIVGPGDVTGRFNYWPLRARDGGAMLCPGTPDDAVQWIDVRDLAAWIIHCAEQSVVGVFAATGPRSPEGVEPKVEHGTIGAIIAESIALTKDAAGSKQAERGPTTQTWVPTEFLMQNGVQIGADIPIWIPPIGDYAGFHRWNTSKAVKNGLRFRPLKDTLAAILPWYDALPDDLRRRSRAGWSLEREAEILKKFATPS